MAIGRRAHRGIPTGAGHESEDLDRFFFRWAARCSAIARQHERRYVDRMVKLGANGEFEVEQGEFKIEQRGYTYGGAPCLTRKEDDR